MERGTREPAFVRTVRSVDRRFVRSRPRAPGCVARGDARGHGPRKGKWACVVVVGEGVRRPFLRGRSKQPDLSLSDSPSRLPLGVNS